MKTEDEAGVAAATDAPFSEAQLQWLRERFQDVRRQAIRDAVTEVLKLRRQSKGAL